MASRTWKLLSSDIGADIVTDTESSLLLCQEKSLITSRRARCGQLTAYGLTRPVTDDESGPDTENPTAPKTARYKIEARLVVHSSVS